jgi:hypothetical protein
MQYWWDNVHDRAMDRRAAGGREIKMVSSDWRVDTLAVFEGCETDEISLHWAKILAVQLQ